MRCRTGLQRQGGERRVRPSSICGTASSVLACYITSTPHCAVAMQHILADCPPPCDPGWCPLPTHRVLLGPRGVPATCPLPTCQCPLLRRRLVLLPTHHPRHRPQLCLASGPLVQQPGRGQERSSPQGILGRPLGSCCNSQGRSAPAHKAVRAAQQCGVGTGRWQASKAGKDGKEGGASMGFHCSPGGRAPPAAPPLEAAAGASVAAHFSIAR